MGGLYAKVYHLFKGNKENNHWIEDLDELNKTFFLGTVILAIPYENKDKKDWDPELWVA